MNAQKIHKWIGRLPTRAWASGSLPLAVALLVLLPASRSMVRLSAVLLSLLLLPSCTKDSPPGSASHTVIFYLGGNNNLSVSIASQLAELQAGYTAVAAGSSSVSANVFVYAALPSESKLLQLNAKAEPQLIAQYDCGRSSTSEMLAEVIATCRRISPTKTYTLVVASHGSGWLPVGALQNPQRSPLGRSIIADDDANPNEMELSEFAAAIPDGMFDAIVLEACLMGGVEVSYALRDKAQYLLAAPAELLDPGFTPIYRNALQILCAANTDVRSRLIAFAERYMAHINRLSGNHRSATLSVVDLRQMEHLAETFIRCCEGGFSIASQPQLATTQHFDRPGQYGDHPACARFFDLEDAARQLTTEAIELTAAIDRAVVWKASTATFMPSLGGFTIESYCGLTTYVPQPELPTLNNAYRATAWWQRTSGNDNLLRVEAKRKIIARTKAKKDYNLTNDIP